VLELREGVLTEVASG